VLLTAGATGCTSPQFEFWMLAPGGSWQQVRDWSTTATFSWNTTGAAAGTYAFEVHARRNGSTGAFEAFADLDYTLTSAGTTPPPSSCGDEARALALQVQRVNRAFSGFHTDLVKLNGKRDRSIIQDADQVIKHIRHGAVKKIHAIASQTCRDDDEDEDANEENGDNNDNDDENDGGGDRHGRSKPAVIAFTGNATAIADEAIAAMQLAFNAAQNAPAIAATPKPTHKSEKASTNTKSGQHSNHRD
jgi:hypothetical protein